MKIKFVKNIFRAHPNLLLDKDLLHRIIDACFLFKGVSEGLRHVELLLWIVFKNPIALFLLLESGYFHKLFQNILQTMKLYWQGH